MLLPADTGRYSYDLSHSYAAPGADLAWRVGTPVSVGHLNWLADGSYHALIYTAGLSATRRTRLAEQAKAGHQFPPNWPAWCGWSSAPSPTAIPRSRRTQPTNTTTGPHKQP